MKRQQALEAIRESGVVAIMRAESSSSLLPAVDAVRAGGVRAIEVSLTTPGALAVIGQMAARAEPDLSFGAGTVLDVESAFAAVQAGAEFIVASAANPEVIELAHRYGVAVLPGAYTPAEVLAAWKAGGDMVKVYPADVGGPGLIRALKAALPQVDLVAVGGADLHGPGEYLRVGATAVGAGNVLANQDPLDSGELAALTERARRIVEELARARVGRKGR